MLKYYLLVFVLAIFTYSSPPSFGQNDYLKSFDHHYSHAQFDSCIQLIKKVLPRYQNNPSQKIKLLNLLGKSYARNYQYEEGQEAYTKAAALNKERGTLSKDDYIASLLGICDVYAADMQTDSMKVLLDRVELMIDKDNRHYGHFLLNRGRENFEFNTLLAKGIFYKL
ncbi:hypothetical protein JMN32_09045 [Fulvivirga sp. 29W222]|uniref:Tetratricopeptide repeat protein n=1 Tax=Fulvivirga marina TaxID=2494733 RepID=A0A937FXQ5_9BACT|nr:hypothetical protein [Fulvivirga marina]MBL6446453.1 hypothetical protein [Fulvivirga marina]